jgi:hypothetical protein
MKLSCLPVSFFDEILAGRMSVGNGPRWGPPSASTPWT